MKRGTTFLILLLLCTNFLWADTEPNNDAASANPISLATDQTGALPSGDNDDWYVFTMPTNGSVVITLDCSSSSLQGRVWLYNADENSLGASGISGAVTTKPQDCMAPGTYYVHVDKWTGDGAYTVRVDVTPPALANDNEPNGTIELSQPITEDVMETGQLGYINGTVTPVDNNDWYYAVLGSNGFTTVTLNTYNSLQARVWMYNKDGNSLGASGIGTSVVKTQDCVAADTIYFLVDRWTGCGSYDLIFDHTPSDFPNDNEPNGLSTQAISLNEGAVKLGNLGYVNGAGTIDNDDWYVTNIDRDGMVEVTIIPTNGLQLRVWQYNSDVSSLGASSITSDTIVFTTNCVGEGTLYFEVDRWSGCGSYGITYRVIEPSQPNDNEPNNTLEQSNFIGENATRRGHLGYVNGVTNPVDNDDWYYSILSNDGAVTFTANWFDGVQGRVWIYDKSGTALGGSSITPTTSTITVDCIAADTVYLLVDRWSGCGTYTISYDLAEPLRNNDNEPNNTTAEAITLSPNISRQGHLGYSNASPNDVGDYYILDSEAPGDISFTCSFEESLQGRIFLLNSAGTVIVSTSITSDTAALTYNATVDDDFYIWVQRWSGCGSYLLKYDNGCPRPQNLRTDPAISVGAILKWNAVGAADKYRLQKRVVGAPSWDPNLNVNIPKYIWYPLDECTDYEFRVEARCGDRNSSFSPIEQFQTLCEPVCFTPGSVFVNTTTSTTAQIGWTEQPIDVGYKVQYVVDGDFSTIFEKTSTAPMVELTGLTPGTNYLFRVNAFCLGNGISGFAFGSFSTTTLREGATAGNGLANLELYPNPASTSVVVNLTTENNFIEVVNAIGQVVMTEQSNGLRTQLDISDLEAGLYQVRATDASGTTTATSGLVIRR